MSEGIARRARVDLTHDEPVRPGGRGTARRPAWIRWNGWA